MTQAYLETSPKARPGKTTLRRGRLTVDCFFAENGRLSKKIESFDGNGTEFVYQFDQQGHLFNVLRDGAFAEGYKYNPAGQRIERRGAYRGFSDGAAGPLRYEESGRLARAGDASFQYDKGGALAERIDSRGATRFFYGQDTLLDKVILPTGAEIRYEYDKANPPGPVRRIRNGHPAAEYVWLNALQLAVYLDMDQGLEYAFSYDASGVLERVRISPGKMWRPGPYADWSDLSIDWLASATARGQQERLRPVFGGEGRTLELYCGADQVGTPKIFTDAGGRLIKEIQRDSFGVTLFDSLPDLFMPIGFAGGLEDPDTGLVHFGYRDYGNHPLFSSCSK